MAPGERPGPCCSKTFGGRSPGAAIYGEVAAVATQFAVADRRLVADRRQAMENVLARVLATAGASIDDIGHLHAHGLSTRTGDAEEVVRHRGAVFRGRDPLPVVAAKSYFGNLGAGSGMVEIIASLVVRARSALPDPQLPHARSGLPGVGRPRRPGSARR